MQTETARQARQRDVAREILVVSKSEAHARTDRKCLRSLLGQEPRIMTSGVEAARLAAEGSVSLLFCDAALDEMTGLELVRLLRLHPELQELPLFVVSVDNNREAVLAAIESGASGYLLRPYSLESLTVKVKSALRGELRSALMQREDAQAPSLEAFSARLAEYAPQPAQSAEDPVESAMQEGVALLRSKAYELAAEHFHNALRMDADHPTAHHGLARCWIGLGHPAKARASMRKAAENYLRRGKYARANAVYEELRKRDPDALDPLSSAVENMVRRGDAASAAGLLLEAHNASRLPENLVQTLSRACHFTDDPLRTARNLCNALEEQGGAAPATALRSKLLGGGAGMVRRVEESQLIAEREIAPLTPMGNLRAILSVAKFTFQAYRRNTLPERA